MKDDAFIEVVKSAREAIKPGLIAAVVLACLALSSYLVFGVPSRKGVVLILFLGIVGCFVGGGLCILPYALSQLKNGKDKG